MTRKAVRDLKPGESFYHPQREGMLIDVALVELDTVEASGEEVEVVNINREFIFKRDAEVELPED